MNKLIMELYFPQTRTSYDLKVPEHITIGELKYVVVQMIEKITEKQFYQDGEYMLIYYDTNEILDDQKFIYETPLKNGSKVLLI